jgi:hypothetical protein
MDFIAAMKITALLMGLLAAAPVMAQWTAFMAGATFESPQRLIDDSYK